MQLAFAIDYIPRRMKELGFENNYLTRWRHFQLEGSASFRIDANNEFFLLINPDPNISVKSKFGMYDLSDMGINEMQYEHRGKIEITNNNNTVVLILFIQVIPTHKN